MTQKFKAAISVILKHEGGYVNHPDDPGGETNFGICKRSYPHLDIANLTEHSASVIYSRDFWQPMKMEKIENEQLALQIFDMGVNAGPKNAVKLIQQLVKVPVDGSIGPITLRAINTHPNQQLLLNLYIDARMQYYNLLVKKNPRLQVFKRGWINRVKSTHF